MASSGLSALSPRLCWRRKECRKNNLTFRPLSWPAQNQRIEKTDKFGGGRLLEGAADIALGLPAFLTMASLLASWQGRLDGPAFRAWGYFAFNYDKSRLAEAPSSFAQLARTATPGLGLMAVILKVKPIWFCPNITGPRAKIDRGTAAIS